MSNPRRHCSGCDGYLATWDQCTGLTEPELTSILEAMLMTYARCNFDGRPMSAADAKVVNSFRDTLAARTEPGKSGLRWREQMTVEGYALEWYCEPPRLRHRFRVIREDWATEHGMPVRRVYEIEEIHGAESSPPPGRADRNGPAGPGPAVPAGQAPAAPPQGS